MGAHRWRTDARRSHAGRAAAAAVLAVVTGSVVVGVGAAAEAPLDVLAAPAAPAAESPLLPLPHLPAAEPETAAVPEQPAERPAAEGAQQDASVSDVPPSRAPAAVPPSAPVSRDGLVPATPCTPSARACVDAVARRAWLFDAGRVVRGPVEVMVGDREDPTPRGTFRVEWKAQQWTSREYLVEMPYSVFFAEGGVAFHQGDRSTPSGGCVKLSRHDAIAFFDYLEIGDEVQVH